MKTRTKVSGQYQRRYASGILMYRERKNLVEVPANATVHILKTEAKRTLCTYKDARVYIPNENLPKRKGEAAPKAKKAKVTKPVVQVETPGTTATVEVQAPAPAPDQVATINAETPAVETPAETPAVEAPIVPAAEPVTA